MWGSACDDPARTAQMRSAFLRQVRKKRLRPARSERERDEQGMWKPLK